MTLLEQMKQEEHRLVTEITALTAKLDELRKWKSKELDFDTERKKREGSNDFNQKVE